MVAYFVAVKLCYDPWGTGFIFMVKMLSKINKMKVWREKKSSWMIELTVVLWICLFLVQIACRTVENLKLR